MELRKNQVEPVKKGIETLRLSLEKKNKIPNSLIVGPTAFGKSIVIAHIANQLENKTIVLQPSKELLEQNYKKLLSLGGEASIFSASMKQKEFGHITYATIGSIKSLGSEFKRLGYQHLIVDEAHLYPRSFSSMFGRFMIDSKISSVLGLTATPFRLQTISDGFKNRSRLTMLTKRTNERAFYKEILHVTQIQEMVKDKYWAELLYEAYDADISTLELNTTGSDYTQESLNEFFEINNIEDVIYRKIEDIREERKSVIVFVPSVEKAIEMSLNVDGAFYIHGEMPTKDRDEVVRKFKSGEIQFIFNVNVLSVGFDDPTVDAIICARPTSSLAWFYQAMGRGTRIHPTKRNCLLIDLAGNVKKFGKLEDLEVKRDVNNEWNLFGTNNTQLTGIFLDMIDSTLVKNDPIINFGSHFNGVRLSKVPISYMKWCLENITWNSGNIHIRNAMLELKDKIYKV
jgi:DNA repair protein RadD